MSHRVPKFAGWVVGGFAALALTFGARVAMATPVNELTCQDDGWTFLGEQISENACFAACYGLHGEDLDHYAWGANGCCRCFF